MCRILMLFACIFLSACNQSALIEKFSNKEDQAATRHYIDLLRNQNFDAIEFASDSSIKSPELRKTLVRMASVIPKQEPISIKLVGAQSFRSNGVTTVNTTFEYEFSERWLLINVAIKKQGNSNAIVGFSVVPQPASLEEQNKFKLAGKSFGQYLVLVAAIVFPLLSIYALVRCIKLKMPGRKWPWVLFILFGLGNLSINWTTGQWAFAPIAAQFLSVSAMSPMFGGSWTFAISLPLGAVLFLLKKRSSVEPSV
ncbi:MAG: hypothetical protein V4607_02535 [Pseudomonadota bacterium]